MESATNSEFNSVVEIVVIVLNLVMYPFFMDAIYVKNGVKYGTGIMVCFVVGIHQYLEVSILGAFILSTTEIL